MEIWSRSMHSLIPRLLCTICIVSAVCSGANIGPPAAAEEGLNVFTLQTRRQELRTTANGVKNFEQVEQELTWDATKTAIIVCDMWDDHWCQGAARRVAELAIPMNRVLSAARKRGALIVHAPSSTVDHYAETQQRQRAVDAPFARPAVPLSTATRWGTTWCWPDPTREPELPIDDSDMGCDCASTGERNQTCAIRDAWTKQIATLEIHPQDAISDHGQEVFNLLEERDIKQVILMGVHLNMCVLGRPFGIRQLVHVGKDVVLMRDMTDTMYNSQMRPFVNHFAGTDLVVQHVERYWCPTVSSVDLVGGTPFRFAEDNREQDATSHTP